MAIEQAALKAAIKCALDDMFDTNLCNYSVCLVFTILSSFFCLFKLNLLLFFCFIFYVQSKINGWLLLLLNNMNSYHSQSIICVLFQACLVKL